jgi:hypothetical protein
MKHVPCLHHIASVCKAKPAMDPGSMTLLSFDDGHVWMDTCRMVAFSDVMVTSMAGLARFVRQYLL